MNIRITYSLLTIKSIRTCYIIQTSCNVASCFPLIHIKPTTGCIPFVTDYVITDFTVRSSQLQHIKELDFLHELFFTQHPANGT